MNLDDIQWQLMFKEIPVVAYRRSPNLRDLLVRAKLQNPATATQPNLSFGTFRCNSKHGYLTCPHIDNERTNYTFNNTGDATDVQIYEPDLYDRMQTM